MRGPERGTWRRAGIPALVLVLVAVTPPVQAVTNSPASFGVAVSEDTLDVEVAENTGGYMLDLLRPDDAERDLLTLALGDDDTDVDATLQIMIAVTNVDETGTVTLSATPATGAAVTASLTDPDGEVTQVSWRWERRYCLFDSCIWLEPEGDGVETAVSTPAASESGQWVRAVASYTDRHGLAKTVASEPAQVTGRPTAPRDLAHDRSSPWPSGISDTLWVEWDSAFAAPAVSSYTVQWRKGSDPDVDARYTTAGVSHDGVSTKAVIRGLTYNKNYVVRVRASNDLGDGPWISVWFWTNRHKPGLNIRLNAANTDSRGIWSDSETMWVTDGHDAVLYRYSISDGSAVLTTFATPASDGGNRGVWSDTETVWVASIGTASLTEGLAPGDSSRCTLGDRCVQAYDMASGERRGRKDVPLDRADPVGLWSDGSILWVTTESGTGNAYAFDLVTGERLDDHDIGILRVVGADSSVNSAVGLWSDGVNLWAAVNTINKDTNSYVRVFALDGSGRTSWADLRVSVSPWKAVGVWSDRETLWVSNRKWAYDTSTIQAFWAKGAVANSPAFFGVARFETELAAEVVEGTGGFRLDLRPGDAEFDTLTLGDLAGADAGLFEMDSGVITPRPGATFDLEAPEDADGDNVYELSATVRDSWDINGNPDTAVDARLVITITVIRARAPGKVITGPGPGRPVDPGTTTPPGENGGRSGDEGDDVSGGGDAQGAQCPSEGASHPFTDVSPSSYAFSAVTCLYELGITTGKTPTTYDPTTTVTRAQMAVFLSRLHSVVTGVTPPAADHPFTDVENSYAAEHIARIYGLGITTGKTPTTYDPTTTVTRAQMAVFLSRLHSVVTGSDVFLPWEEHSGLAGPEVDITNLG